jgi:3-methyl-2-oxobutanoate hydroxymethyltransferase
MPQPSGARPLAGRIAQLRDREVDAPPLVMVTAYDALSARIADDAGVDLILVGDSAATTILGYSNTRDVSIEEMLILTAAARRGTRTALLVGDLPFGTYEASDAQAIDTARQFMQVGCDLVKLEGGGVMCDRVRALVADGIPVVGHVGLLPQSAESPADLKARGRSAAEAQRIVRDALDLEAAGASLIVVEAVPAPVGSTIASRVQIPVIGIGAGSAVDGQVLVYTDLLGLGHGHMPRFVRTYAEGRAVWAQAIAAYARDVRTRAFPAAVESYGMTDSEFALFRAAMAPSPE